MQMHFDEYFNALKDKRIAVLGLGVSNQPLVKLLLSYGCTVIGCDRTENPDDAVLDLEKSGAVLRLGERYLDGLEADIVFRTPGMHPQTPALVALREKGTKITSEMEVFFELCPCKIIAVTGSDGKTTTTTLISEMLKAAGKTVWLGGNIGTPLLPVCRQMQAEDYAVVELSSFQLMDMERSADVAVVTNLAPNHLDVHKDMQEYIDAKKNIFAYQNADGKLILNKDNEITDAFAGNGEIFKFSRRKKTDVWCDGTVIFRGDTPVMKAEDILLPGVHNIENYMAAMLAVEGLVPDAIICQVAKTFGGVEHRIELVRVKDGVKFYNDSIASSPSRTMAGLRSFTQKVILIAGGYDKNIAFDELGPEICRHTKAVFLNGATAGKIRQAVEACPEYTKGAPLLTDCGDFASAVKAAAEAAEPGDVVLMSPASAAFDQFKNFMERGKFYKKQIMEL